jgi:hypothetical protein
MTKNLTQSQKQAVEEMEAHVKSECSQIDREQRFRDMLDECYSFDSVGGPFAYMSPSRVLEEMDPTAFRCGVNDYMDGEDVYEIDGECYDRKEVEEAAEEFIDELRDELSEAEAEIEDDEEPDRSEVEEIEARIEACESHAW